MLILHTAPSIEPLVAELSATLAQPLHTPLAQEILLIQSRGLERWLSQSLSHYFKVFANYQYLFPEQLFSRLAKRLNPELANDRFEREALLWRLETLLRNLDDDCFAPLQAYLSGEQAELKRYQLAEQLAGLFDRYQTQRPDWLDSWQQGGLLLNDNAERWQAALWQRLTADGQPPRHHLWQQATARLQAAPAGRAPCRLPQRLSVFGINHLPPLSVDFLIALAKHVELHVYALMPDTTANAHPLLQALAEPLAYLPAKLTAGGAQVLNTALPPLADNASNLQTLQSDLSRNQITPRTLAADGSICIHACHSRMREVEVLKDQLLATLEAQPALELRDIVVMAADMDVYAPFIAAVFDDIPHSIADRSLKTANTALETLLRFFNVAQSRWGWQTVLDLLEQPQVAARFELGESDLELIRYWLQETRIRWGQSAAHKTELALPATAQNTWQAGLERLFMGYALGEIDEFVDGVLPFADIEGHAAQALGGLDAFLQLLAQARHDLTQPRALSAWQQWLSDYANNLLQADDAALATMQPLFAELAASESVGHSGEVSWDAVRQWLENRRRDEKSSQGFLRGQLTFCSLQPMRPVPFAVIALLGLNEGEFPNSERPPSFDLIARHPRAGDLTRRDTDRQLFVETLLSARQQLILSYVGQSIQTNQPLPPSLLVSELLEVLQDSYQLTDILVLHPLHPFSPRYFSGDAQLFSFNPHLLAVARQLQSEKPAATVWWQGEIATAVPEVIELDEMLRFFRQPQRYFLQRQLGLYLDGLEAQPEEREPFALDGLERYSIQHDWLDAALNGEPLSQAVCQAQGRWLAAMPGQIVWQQQERELGEFATQIQALALGEPLPPLAVDVRVGDFRIVGKLAQRYEGGRLLYRYSSLKGKDFFVAWLQHLLANQLQPQTTYLISKDALLCFTPDLGGAVDLEHLLAMYLAGQQRPDAFFVEPALVCMMQATKTRAQLSPAQAALNALQFALDSEFEPELRQLFGQCEDLAALLGDEFAPRCLAWWLQVWRAAMQQVGE